MAEYIDKTLVKYLIKGKKEAFDHFFNTYFPRLYRFVLPRVGQDADLAEEVVQAVLSKAIYKLETYRGEASLYTWLCTFCRFEISAQFRQKHRAYEHVEFAEDQPSVQAALESLSLAESSPDLLYSRHELARLIQVTLDHLPEVYSEVLQYKYLQGMSMKEISKRIGRSSKAVESILSRARVAFRDGFASLTENRALI